MKKWYVGMIKGTPKMLAFQSEITPTKSTHENLGFFIGPFKSQIGAEYAASVGPKASIKGVEEYENLARMNY